MRIETTNIAGHVTLTIAGRLDTASAQQATEEIERSLAQQGEVSRLTCNMSEVSYISSSGLRIVLSLAKRYHDFKLSEVQPDVYRVLEMTGFTKIMTVERGLRRLSVDGCEIIGRGGVGTVYRLDDDTIIKVFREGTTMDEVNTEITMAKEAFVLGMPTAISFDVVNVGDQLGLVYELLKADTLSACISREPGRIDEFARKYADLFRHLHAIEVPPGRHIPDAMVHEEESIRHISRYFGEERTAILLDIIRAVPKGNRLLHLDLQTKNTMMQGDELMLIDMGEVGYGHPLLDLAHAYSAMVSFVGDYEAIIGIKREQGAELWRRMMGYYFEGQSETQIAHRLEQIETVSCVRNFSWLSLSDSFPEEVVNECREQFETRVMSRLDHIRKVRQTLDDWTLS